MYGGKSALHIRACGYYNPSALPALLSWLFLLAPATVSLSLLSHYCWLCFLGLSVSGTYSFQRSRHLESMQAGAPKLATEAPGSWTALEGECLRPGGWSGVGGISGSPPFPVAAVSSQKPGPCYTPPSGGLQNQFPSRLKERTVPVYSSPLNQRQR